MDPNENLKEQRCLWTRILQTGCVSSQDAIRLAELAEALDAWILRGGHLPELWASTEEMDV